MMSARHSELTAHETRSIAVVSMTDPRTVRRFADGGPMKSTTEARIREAVVQLGLDHLLGRKTEGER